jgi:hypothetical protein
LKTARRVDREHSIAPVVEDETAQEGAALDPVLPLPQDLAIASTGNLSRRLRRFMPGISWRSSF